MNNAISQNPGRQNRLKPLFRTALIAAALVLAAGPAGFGADGSNPAPAMDGAKVGERGELDQIAFTGQKSFSAYALRQALKYNMDFLLASQPDADLAACLKTLQDRLRTGYRHAGFSQAAVRAGLDAAGQRIVVSISEGPRSFCGDVRVSGVTNLSAEALAARIAWRVSSAAATNPPPGLLDAVGSSNLMAAAQISNGPAATADGVTVTSDTAVQDAPLGIWEAGLPAPFDAGARRSMAQAITNAFADLGYFSPRFTWQFEPRPPQPLTPAQQRLLTATNSPPEVASFLRALRDGRLVDLVVSVQNEGPPCVIGNIEVAGAEKNSPEELLTWLGLAPGQKLTRELLLAKDRQMFDSGRFAAAALEPGHPNPSGKVPLRIVVDEVKQAPKLISPLSGVETAMLQLRKWLVNWPSQPADMVVRANFGGEGEGRAMKSVEIYLSPAGGVLCNVSAISATSGVPALDWALLVRSEKVGFYDGTSRQELVLTNQTFQVALGIDLQATNFTFSMGFSATTSGPPFLPKLNLAPAGFVKLAGLTNLNLRLSADELTSLSSNVTFRADAKTGRPLELRIRASPDTAWLLGGNGETLDARFESKAFARAEADLSHATAGFDNRFDTNQPLGSSLAFLVEEVFRSPLPAKFGFTNVTPDRVASVSAALDKFSLATILKPLERLNWPTNPSPDEETMTIPSAGAEAVGAANPLDFVAAWVLRDGGKIVPPSSWLAALLREKVLDWSGHADPNGAGWRRLYDSDDVGPLGCWMLARTADAGRKAFALKGLTRLSREDFRNDCRALLDGDAVLNESLRNFLAEARNLSDADVESLCGLMNAEDANVFRAGMNALRQTSGPVTLANLAPALDAWWDGALRARISAALRELAAQPDH